MGPVDTHAGSGGEPMPDGKSKMSPEGSLHSSEITQSLGMLFLIATDHIIPNMLKLRF